MSACDITRQRIADVESAFRSDAPPLFDESQRGLEHLRPRLVQAHFITGDHGTESKIVMGNGGVEINPIDVGDNDDRHRNLSEKLTGIIEQWRLLPVTE